MWFAKTCSVCKKRVKQSELRKIETIFGSKITCCEKCAKYFKVKQKKK